jgi:hypothetical protein
VPLDVIEVDGLAHAGDLVKFAHIVPEVLIINDTPQIAFEVVEVNTIESCG